MSTNSHTLVLANEKGGTGKSTVAVHLAVALAARGARVRLFDLDERQRTSFRYLENRGHYIRAHERPLPLPEARVLAPGADVAAAAAEAAQDGVEVLVFDTPGRDSPEARTALALADTLVTPINDSFIDFDLIGQVDPESYQVTRPSFYAETVWKAKAARARTEGRTLDWVLLRNRLSTLEARNRRRVGTALEQLSKRVGFRIAPGLSERVIYRELFPKGLTLLDIEEIGEVAMSHVAARAEIRELLQALHLEGVRAEAC